MSGFWKTENTLPYNDGFNMFADNEFVIDEGIVDYQMLIDYITNFLNGSIHKEDAQIEGRITVI